MAFLMFSLPDYSSRANLQLVEKLSDLDTNEKLMVYVQQNNQTVAKTIKVLHYTLFFSAIFLGVILKTKNKNLKNEQEKKKIRKNKTVRTVRRQHELPRLL